MVVMVSTKTRNEMLAATDVDEQILSAIGR
jgi:hypothetical protein